MKKTELKKLIKEAFLTEKKSNLLNENSPGFDNRKQGGALPTLESVKAAYQAKKLKEASAEEEIETTKELTAAVKDLDDAKKEAGLNEDEFAPYDSLIGPVIAGMVEIRKYVENVAPEHLSTFEIADEAIKAFDEKMAYGDDDDLGVPGDNALGLEETIKRADAIIAEAKMEKEFKAMYAEDEKREERMRIANELFPEIAKEQEGGKLVNFKPLSQKQRDEVYDNLSEGLLKEALNKPLNKFGQDLEKRLNALGFETKIFPGKSAVPQEASDAIIVKGSKKAGISYIKNTSGHEHIQVMVNADEINKLKKVKSYFQTGDGQYSPDKEIGWVIKNVKLTNPGDIMASDVQRYGKRAILEYYTSQEGGEKVKTRDVEF